MNLVKKFFQSIFEYFILFFIYGGVYFIIECVYKGALSDYRMFMLGGIIGCLIGLINNIFTFDTDILLQGLFGALTATLAEAVLGDQWNIVGGMGIWDYSALPFSAVNGQVNLMFFAAWIFLSIICVVIDDMINYRILKNQPAPYYKLFGKTIFRMKSHV